MLDTPRVYWQRARPLPRPALIGSHDADVAVIGGGIAGLFAARALLERGKRVVLIEADVCGGGASGSSSGFITPDSELQAVELTRRFGDATAKELYGAVKTITDLIHADIAQGPIPCDCVEAACLFVARDAGSKGDIDEEHEARRRLGFDSTLLDETALKTVLGETSRYAAGLRYGGTFAIDAFAYCRGLAHALETWGLRIYESSPVLSAKGGTVRTEGGEVRCKSVVVATDRFTPALGIERPDVFSVQTVLALSAPLPRDRLAALFPSGPLMVWESALDYRYFRPTGDGRLLLGGNTLSRTYLSSDDDTSSVVPVILDEVRRCLPGLGQLEIEWQWPGYIGVTRDLLPIAGRHDAHTAVAICGSGLPWAALAGLVAARAVLGETDRLDHLFDPRRTFTELELFQPVLRKPLTFALSHLHTKFWLKGTSGQLRRRKWAIGAALGLAAAGALAWLVSRDDDAA